MAQGTFPIQRAPEKLGVIPTTAVRANIDVRTGAAAVGRTESELGEKIFRLGRKMDDIKTAEDTAQGIAEYNNFINTYNESLKDKRPEEYLEDGQLPETLLAEIGTIRAGKTRVAQRTLQNRFIIWNETNRAAVAVLAGRNKTVQAEREIPDRLAEFASMSNKNIGEREARNYLNGLTPMLGTKIVAPYMNQYHKLKEKNDILLAIDAAEKAPTQENITLAEKAIATSKYFPLQEDKDKFESRLRSAVSQTRQHRGLARKAVNDENAKNIVDGIINNTEINTIIPTEDNERTFAVIQDRVANNSMDNTVPEADAQLDMNRAKLQRGTIVSETQLLQWAEVLGTRDLAELKILNEENKKLIKRTPEIQRAYDMIEAKHKETIGYVWAEPGFGRDAAKLIELLDADKETYVKEMRTSMATDIPANEIYNHINEKYEATRKGALEHGFWRWYKSDIHDFIDDLEVRPVGMDYDEHQQERLEAIIHLLQVGKKKDIERVREALVAGWFR